MIRHTFTPAECVTGGRVGGRASGLAREAKAIAMIVRLWPRMPMIAQQEIRRYGRRCYQAGYKQQRREQVA